MCTIQSLAFTASIPACEIADIASICQLRSCDRFLQSLIYCFAIWSQILYHKMIQTLNIITKLRKEHDELHDWWRIEGTIQQIRPNCSASEAARNGLDCWRHEVVVWTTRVHFSLWPWTVLQVSWWPNDMIQTDIENIFHDEDGDEEVFFGASDLDCVWNASGFCLTQWHGHEPLLSSSWTWWNGSVFETRAVMNSGLETQDSWALRELNTTSGWWILHECEMISVVIRVNRTCTSCYVCFNNNTNAYLTLNYVCFCFLIFFNY